MITEIVRIPLPGGMTRDELMDKYRATVGRWRDNPDLLRKHYFFDEVNACGGGMYLWKSREAADRWHGKEYRELIQAHYGSKPRIEYFDTMIIVDNERGTVEEAEAERGPRASSA